MHRRLTLLAGAAILAAGPAAFAQTQPQPAQAAPGGAPAAPAGRAEVVTGQEFMRLVSMSDRFEVASSRLAQETSQNAKVKQFAEHMVRDHTKTTQELQQLIQLVPGAGTAAEVPLPNSRESQGTSQSGQITNAQGGPQHQGLDEKHTTLLQQLQAAKGAEFDRVYARQQVAAHQQAVDLFRNYSQAGDTPQLKEWAAKTLPVLEQHLQLAQALQQGTQG